MDLNKMFANLASILDVPDRIEGLVSTFFNADWKRARRRGAGGLAGEALASLTGHNAPMLRVSHFNVSTSWSGIAIERLLQRHGIALWDRGLAGDDLYFRVKRRQMVWAEYVLLRAGVPVAVVREPRNIQWTEKFPPGDEPAKHRASRRGRRSVK